MKRRFPAVLAVLAAALLLCSCSAKDAAAQFIAMDTSITLRLSGAKADTAVSAAEKQIHDLESLLSRTLPDSQVSRLNDAAGTPQTLDPRVRALLTAAQDYAFATGGAFDATIAPVVSAWGFTEAEFRVPDREELDGLLSCVGADRIDLSHPGAAALASGTQIDLGGIAKGYATDLMHALCDEYEITSGTVALGGNIYVRGTKEGGALWQVGVQDPASSGLLGIIGLSDAYAVTSGGYQRYFEENGIVYHHIIDPATGCPADSGLTSVTVIASAASEDGVNGLPGSGTMCDALSTALFVMGEEAALEFRRCSGLDFDLVLVTTDGRVVITDGIAQHFTKQEGSGYQYETVS